MSFLLDAIRLGGLNASTDIVKVDVGISVPASVSVLTLAAQCLSTHRLTDTHTHTHTGSEVGQELADICPLTAAKCSRRNQQHRMSSSCFFRRNSAPGGWPCGDHTVSHARREIQIEMLFFAEPAGRGDLWRLWLCKVAHVCVFLHCKRGTEEKEAQNTT